MATPATGAGSRAVGSHAVGSRAVGSHGGANRWLGLPAMDVGDRTYSADITWTTHGVPHIVAADLSSLAFGQGWACAADHLATIADQIVKVRSERARFFGPGPAGLHLNTDFGYRALGVAARGAAQPGRQPDELVQAVTGYAAGLNAWLAEHGRDALPVWCRDAPWVRPVSTEDLFTLYADLAIIASGRNLAAYIGAAQPPAVAQPPGAAAGPGGPLAGGLGSNGWALGRDATATGRGMVVANPHFPWHGEARFWECHLVIPGSLDVYGASLIGTPGVQIGLNRHVAWTHTFSRGNRFVVYKLTLEPSEPTAYRHGDDVWAMAPASHTVEVLGEGGALTPVTRTLWATHHGPMVDLPFLGWTTDYAFAYRDANLENDRFLPLVLDLDRATSVHDLRAALARHGGLPWVNTMAADDAGDCLYVDSSPTPHVARETQEAFVAAIDSDPIANLLYANRVALLDGSDPAHDWLDHPEAPEPGLVPFEDLPQVLRTDHTFNANDPYWLPHANDQLPEHSPFHGLYRRPVSPRTRMNALLLSGAGPVGPSGESGRFTPDDLEAAVLGNHSLLAEMLGDQVVVRLRAAGQITFEGRDVDLAAAAEVLAGWDRRFELDSVGAVLWRELLCGFTDDALRDAGPLWAEPFDPEAPVATPHSLTPAPAEGPDPVVEAAARALVALEQAGIAPDAPLGAVQYVERGGRRIPLHGANEVEGIANVVAPIGALERSDLEPLPEPPPPLPGRTERSGLRVGGYPIIYGTSFVMVAWFDDDGAHARGLLAYGQSGDPDSVHHADQTEAFSAKALRPFLLDDDAIAADAVRRRTVTG